MKQIVAILVVVSLSFQCFVQLGLVALYELNKDYVTKEFCVNKNKPQMKCCGKCYLRKQMKKVSGVGESSEKPGSQKSEQIEWAVFLVSEPVHFSTDISQTQKNFYLENTVSFYSAFVKGIFRPPQSCT